LGIDRRQATVIRSRALRLLVTVAVSLLVLLALFGAPTAASPTSAERSLLAAMNQTRAAYGLAPLRIDARLERAARGHSRDMLRRGYFAHGNFRSRLIRVGARGPAIGENLAWGTGSRATPQGVVAAWLASPRHRANLLRPGFRRIGIGTAIVIVDSAKEARVVTVEFSGV
jgi:uncharacterized protein YkwD